MNKSQLADSTREFKNFIKKNLEHSTRAKNDALNKYKDSLKADIRMKGGKLVKHIHQHGGSWSDFTNFFTKTIPKAAKTVYNKALKPAGKFLYEKGKEGVEYAKKKPLTAISKVAGAASLLPTPASGVLKGVATAAGVAGQATGKGHSGKGKAKGIRVDVVTKPMPPPSAPVYKTQPINSSIKYGGAAGTKPLMIM